MMPGWMRCLLLLRRYDTTAVQNPREARPPFFCTCTSRTVTKTELIADAGKRPEQLGGPVDEHA